MIRLPSQQGFGSALNVELKTLKVIFIRMDSDDLSRPERLDILLKCLSENPNCDVIGSYIANLMKKHQNMIN